MPIFSNRSNRQEEWASTDREDCIEITNNKNVFTLPKESISSFVNWAVHAHEGDEFCDEADKIRAEIENHEFRLEDQNFQPLIFPVSKLPWFLNLINVEVEDIAEDITEDNDEVTENQKLYSESWDGGDERQDIESPPLEHPLPKLEHLVEEPVLPVSPLSPRVNPVSLTSTTVTEIAYTICPNCQHKISLKPAKEYNGLAINCPNDRCQSILLLFASPK